MPLSDDQKAMLRLLAQREQGYDDLAALMGLSVDEVRVKVKDALAQLEEEGLAPPAPAEPPPPPAPPPEPDPPAPREPEAVAAPAAPEPVASKPSAATAPPQRPKLTLPKSNGARAALAASLAAVVALLVVLALGGGEDSGDPTAASGGDGAAAEETIDTATTNPKLTQAVLSPLDGGDAKGLATFGRVKNELALQIEAEGLEPTRKGQSYTVWLYESADKMLPLASTAVDESGRIGAQVQVPTEVLAYLASETFDQLDVSLTADATLKASLAKAAKEKKPPAYTGTDVLRGTITGPIIGAANKKQAE